MFYKLDILIEKYELFQTKEWDRDSYIKMIFVGVRALYEEFLVLKNQVNEIKEIKQNEI